MKRPFFFFAISIIIVFRAMCQPQELLTDSISKQLRIGVEGFKERYHSPSIVVAVVHEKDIIFSEALGYMDVEKKTPTSIDAKYPIQSLTKVFTATMLMQLVQKGVVTLGDNVKKYVAEFKDDFKVPGNSGTTLLQLATHTSGLPRNSPADIQFTKQIDRWFFATRNEPIIEGATTKEFLRSLAFINKEYPEYQLLSYGDRHYSNLGYSLLGIALERAAKVNYTDYIINNICRPLDMHNSGFYSESSRKTNVVAKGYYYRDSTKDFIAVPEFKPNSIMPAGGMYASARDLAKFISFQFETNTGMANNVLSEENRAMMRVFNIAWRPSYPFVFHEGSMLGYRCEMALNSDLKIGWVILTNTTDFDFSRMNRYIGDLVMPLFSKTPVTDLQKFAGIYKLDGDYDSLRIYLKDGNLYSTYLHDVIPDVPLSSAGDNKFKGLGKGSYVIGYEFIPDDKGEIKFLNMGQLMWVKQ